MKCPHCLESFHEQTVQSKEVWSQEGAGGRISYFILRDTCPACKRLILRLHHRGVVSGGIGGEAMPVEGERFIVPSAQTTSPIPESVPEEIAEDYREASAVLKLSPKASAALSRRCLQGVLRNEAGTKKKDLADQIDEVLESKVLPSHLADNLDSVRTIGNFAAHPIKSKQTGVIVAVEPEEAEWGLEVVSDLLDWFYTQVPRNQERRQNLNAKLKAAGKPSLKLPDKKQD